MIALVIGLICAGIVLLVVLAAWSLAVLREYERGVVFRMGHARPSTVPDCVF